HIEALGRSFSFNEWEGIHTENSHKYCRPGIEALAGQSGFSVEGMYYDSRRYFADAVWRVSKASRKIPDVITVLAQRQKE
ncbi:MAG: L-histidine N(alpha)-methyltransferase, partial [Acidobacteriota bacterium]